MVQQVIQVVQVSAFRISRVERPCLVVSLIEAGSEPPKQPGECQFRFTVAIIDRWVDQHRQAGGAAEDIARPQVAVQQAGLDGMLIDPAIEVVADSAQLMELCTGKIFMFYRQLDLGVQPVLAEKGDPVRSPAVNLRNRTDVVVVIQPIGLRGSASVQGRKLMAEAFLVSARGVAGRIDPFQQDKGGLGVDRQHLRYPDGITGSEQFQSPGFNLKHTLLRCRVPLQQVCMLFGDELKDLVDAAAAHRDNLHDWRAIPQIDKRLYKRRKDREVDPVKHVQTA